MGSLKCNVDASVRMQEIKLGFGFVVRDFQGRMIVAKNGMMHGPMEALVAEALGCREAMKWL